MSQERPIVTTEAGTKEFDRVLILPAHCPPREGPNYQQLYTSPLPEDRYSNYLLAASDSEFLAVDFETKGNDYTLPDFELVGVGLAWESGSVYLDWVTMTDIDKQAVRTLILNHPRLLAHNVYFDGGVVKRIFGRHAHWFCCTLAAYKRTANEGWPGQRHGLKNAMKEILLWENTNEDELDAWLCFNGHYMGNKRKDESYEALKLSFDEGKLKPRKGEMWRAPAEILGKYCVLDAEACYLLFTKYIYPIMRDFPELHKYLTEDFMYCIEKHIDQKFHGILMDRDGLKAREAELEKSLEDLGNKFFSNPDVERGILLIEEKMKEEFLTTEPPQYNKARVRPPEPAKYRMDGSVSKIWQNWVANEHKYQPKLSGNWVHWKERLDRIERKEDPDYLFNPNTGQQLAVLLYEHMKFPVVDSLRTEKGAPGTSIKALKQMGEIGNLLVEKAWINKELSYIRDYLERTESRPTLHPSFRVPGTTTGRLSSSEPNLQQVPKSKAVMSLFRARPGHVLVDLDFSALEPVVATEFSQDPNMMKIYGEGAKPNDIYLFVAAHIPDMGGQVRATGYDPYNPTKETLAKAKKECKSIRAIAKTVVLACQYGAGVGKIMETLENDNIYLPEDQVRAVWETYWDLFAEVRTLGRNLEDEWRRNGGYILNGLGLPMCVDRDSKKDILNRFIQSTGHDILIKYIRIYTEELTRREIPWLPHVLDWHDASAVEVPEAYLNETIEVYKWGLDELNRQLGGTIRLKGTPSFGPTMADIKEPEE